MLWMARATNIAMCHIAVAVEERRESAYGYKETSSQSRREVRFPLVS